MEPVAVSVRPSVFRRHPRLTLVAINLTALLLLAGLDHLAAALYVERPSGREPHPWYHHGLAANFRGTDHWLGRPFALRTNALGLRDDAPRAVPLTGTRPRLLLLGDSFTEGVGVAYEETFAGRLARALPGWEVLNGGVCTYAPRLYWRRLEYLLDHVGLKVDEIVVFVDVSDVQDELWCRDFVPSPEPRVPWTTRLHRYLRWHSYVYFMVDCQLALREYAQPARGRGQAVGAEFGPARDPLKERFAWASEPGARVRFDAERGRWEEPAIWERWGREGMALATDDMAQVVALCQRHGIRLSLAVYPWPAPYIAQRLTPCRHEEHWRAFCQERGLGFLDLFPAFITDEAPADVIARCFLPGDFHWNAAGHERVATAFLAWWQAIHSPAAGR